jgi:hypothetical protein
MKKNWTLRWYALVMMTSFCPITFGQTKAIVIPFQLTDYNNIVIRAVLNKQDTVSLMFHTAANDVTLTEAATRKIKSLNFNGSADSIKSWGGDVNSARLSENNVLQIGELEWGGVAIWENKNSGQQTDGKFGIQLFKDKVVALDFDKKTMTITETLPKNIRKYEKLKLTNTNDMLFVEADCQINEQHFTNQFLIHSGYAGAVLFDDIFANGNKMDEKLTIVGEKSLKDSYGNVLKTKKAILPTLQIGRNKLLNVSVGFFTGALGRQKMSVIGGDILRRFNIVIDSKRAYIYLKSNKLKKEKYTNV